MMKIKYPVVIDKLQDLMYNTPMLKKSIFISTLLFIAGLVSPVFTYAQQAATTCTAVTQYGGAVSYICGAETHVPVATGVGDNLALVGAMALGASALLFYLSKKARKVSSN
jgi:hypothetical protein